MRERWGKGLLDPFLEVPWSTPVSSFLPLREPVTATLPGLARPPPQVFSIAPIRVMQWTLSGSDWWISAAYTIHHLSPGLPGPRGWDRVATLLHRWPKPRVVSDRPETGISAGQSVGVGVFPAPPVVHLEPEILEGQEPPRHPCVRVIRAGHPLEWHMVGEA